MRACARDSRSLVIAFPPPPVSALVMRRLQIVYSKIAATPVFDELQTQAFAMMVKANQTPVWRII